MKKGIVVGIVLLGGLVGVAYKYWGGIVSKTSTVTRKVTETVLENGYSNAFRDRNAKHLKAAKCWKKKKQLALPVDSLDDLKQVDGLEPFSSDVVVVDPMSHSRALLLPEANELLEELGREFQAELKKRNLPKHRLIVTSMTRSKESQAQLEKTNVNAASDTAHWYGTTFDITYKRYQKSPLSQQKTEGRDLKNALEKVLSDLRKSKSIVVQLK